MSSDEDVSEYDSDVEAHVELGDFKYSAKKPTKTTRAKPRLRAAVVPKPKKQTKSHVDDDDMILAIDDAEEAPKKSRLRASSRASSSARTKTATKRNTRGSTSNSRKSRQVAAKDSDSEDELPDDDDFVIESDEDQLDDAGSDIEIFDDDFDELKPPSKRRKTAVTPTKLKRIEELDDELEPISAKVGSSQLLPNSKRAASTARPAQDDDDDLKLTPAKKKRKQPSVAEPESDDAKPKAKRQRTTKPKQPKKASAAASSNEDIMDIDTLGDFAAGDDEFGDAAFEEMDEKKPSVAPDGDLNIVFDAPDDAEEESNPKKRKRVSDVTIRRATKEEKEHATLMHQAHLLALMASYLLHSRAADSGLLQAAVLSLMNSSAINAISPPHGINGAKGDATVKPKKKPLKKAKKTKSDASEALENGLGNLTQQKSFAEQDIDEIKQNMATLIKEFRSHFTVSDSLFPFDLTRDSVQSLMQKPPHPLDISYRLLAKLSHHESEPQLLELQEAVMAFVALCRALGVPTRLVSILKPLSWKVTSITLSQSLSGISHSTSNSKKALSDLNAKDPSGLSLKSELQKGLSAALATFSPTSRLSSSAAQSVINIDSDNEGVKQDPVASAATVPELQITRSDTIPIQAIAGLIQNVKEEEKSTQTKRRRKSKGSFVEPPAMWLEVYCPTARKWIPVDLLRDLIDEPTKFQGGDDALVYVFAFEGKLIADVTKRYCERWSLSLRQIPNYEWVEETLSKYNSKFGRSTDDQLERTVFELKEFSTALEKEPFPTSQEQYRHHPLYVLEKYVGKYDMLWPPDQPALGYFKNQPIYPRKHVYHLHTREKWIQHGMQVKEGEESVKRMRKITYKKNEEDIKESEYFGEWQTETYKPPPIVDGIIPKNEYGNVYLFKPEMMPIGAVKVSLPGVKQICKKLQIDYAEALVGWEHVTGRFSKPQFDGVIIEELNKDVVIAAWQQNNERKLKEEAKKAAERSLRNWIRLTKTLMVKHKISSAYVRHDSLEKSTEAVEKKKAKAPKKKATKVPEMSPEVGPHEHTFPKDQWQQISDTKWLKAASKRPKNSSPDKTRKL